MRPHHLLEACLRLFALNSLSQLPLWVAAALDQFEGDAWLVVWGAVLLHGLGLPMIGWVLLLVYAPKLCRWLHDAGADPGRADAAPTRVVLLRIGIALIGLEHLVWSVYNAKQLFLWLGGLEVDRTQAIVYGAVQLIVGVILVFGAHRIARTLDGWGSRRRPEPLIVEPR